MTPDEIAAEIYTDLEDTSSVSQSGISYWLRTNIGALNNRINTVFNAPASGNLPFYQGASSGILDMEEQEKNIFKSIYLLRYYSRQIQSSLGAAGLDPIVEIESDGARVRKISRNEISKTWITLRKDVSKELDNQIFAYTYNKSSPKSINGDDVYSSDTVISYATSPINIVVV